MDDRFQPNKSAWPFVLLIMAAGLAGCYHTGTSTSNIVVRPFDFAPSDGTYNLNCSGRALQWSDVEFYTPQISLQDPAPADVQLFFWVKKDRTMWADPTLGFFHATIRQGQRQPAANDIVGPTHNGGAAPQGAPNETRGNFYLGCTRKCKVKGSEGKDDNRSNTYLEIFNLAVTGGFDWEAMDKQSPRHSISCR